MAIPLGLPLPTGSSNRPGRWRGNPPAVASNHPYWFCSRWGLPCHPCYQGRGALLPHPFTLTCRKTGGLLSVALSLKSPSPAVNRHRVSVEPGLSSPAHGRRRPSGHLPVPYKALPGGMVKVCAMHTATAHYIPSMLSSDRLLIPAKLCGSLRPHFAGETNP